MAYNRDCVAKLKRLEQRLDRQFSVFGIKFGYDSIIGLVPVVGDLVTAGIGMHLIIEARRQGAHRWTVFRMLINWAIDMSLGMIPIAGDLFDLAFRSNTKNVKLLIADLEQRACHLREMNREQHLQAI